ncbi:MAG TPA: hypothetical protein VG500_10270 [Gemmatimonadales bacterium]|nr:hypothetical protein [Gemmatimonadales bacterium]
MSGVRVVLHRVTPAVQGPVDSMVSGRDGRFRFSLDPDTTALHLLSARHDGIEYFSTPLDSRGAGRDRPVRLVVHDTSSTAPVTVSARHVVIPRPGEDGSREVLDLVLLANAGSRTRVAPDSLSPSWTGPLPPASEGLERGESDVSPDAVMRRGDTAVVSAPIAPGEKQLAFQYHLPAGRREIEIPVGAEAVGLSVLLEEPGASVIGPGLALADSQAIEGRSFRRWTGEVPANATVRVTLPGRTPNATPVLAVMVALLALALLGAGWHSLARKRPVPVDRLVGEIALLDTRYQGREAETAPAEWAGYLERRAKLKADVAAALARESGGR